MRRKLKNRKCEYCKLVFRPRRNEQIFCSRKCAGLSRQCRVVIECAYCQKKSERPLNKALKPKSRLNFCNRDCKERAQRIGGISAIQTTMEQQTVGMGIEQKH